MKAYVITIRGNDYSERCAKRCIESAAKYGVAVEIFEATGKDAAILQMQARGLEWTWPTSTEVACPHTGLILRPYRTADIRARIGCAISHLRLWEKAVLTGPILILEHDAVFENYLPALPEKFDAVMLNNPHGATPKGAWWSQQIEAKGHGAHRKTAVFNDGRPDGLAGNSAYVISPAGASKVLGVVERVGLWPNDAALCRQLVPDLYEAYPFVTIARQEQSTSGGYAS